MSTYISSEMAPIGKFLHDVSALKVPTFQRNYAWTDEEIRQLWLDLMEASGSGQKEYFLGPMVLKTNPDSLEIIDGQQRIATIYIILSVIRRIFRENGDNKRADWFNNEYFGKQDVLTLEISPKFHMNEINDLVFQKFILADISETKIQNEMKGLLKKDTNFLLFQAITIIWELIQERQKKISNTDFNLEFLIDIQKYLRENVYVLFLTVTDEADAYVIFETLNDRGRELTTMDLLKNHVFGKSGGYIEQVKLKWSNFCNNLSDIDPRERFLHHYWTSYYGRTSKSQLFRLMRGQITSPETALRFVNNLVEASRLYSALNNFGHPYWITYDQRTRDNLEVLILLDAQQALPILLSAAQEFDQDEFGKLTEILVVMAVRYNLIGEERTGVLANYYVEIPEKIRKGTIMKSAKFFREIRPIYPSDEDFIQAFSVKVLKDTRKARYILAKFEEYESGGTNNIVKDPKKVNLEHILPLNPSQDWEKTLKSIGDENIDDYINRIGNLALVSATLNKTAGSKDFETKKKLIFSKDQNIKFTHMVNEYSSWLKEDIKDRQMKMGKQAAKIWRINIE